MELLVTIVAISTIIWYLVDKAKLLWADLSWGKWLTIATAGILSFVCVFAFNVDLLAALGLVESNTVSMILTALIFMSGSSAVSEIIERVKGND